MGKALPPVTKICLTLLCLNSAITFILRYSTYLHLVSSDYHAQDHQHLLKQEDTATIQEVDANSVLPNPMDIYVPLITLVPLHSSLIWRPWLLFTTSFIESGFVSFVIAFSTILYTGRYIETLWGSREFLIYIGLVTTVSNLLTFMIYYVKLTLSTSTDTTIQIAGSSAIIIALLVAIKQRIPSHYLLFLGGSIRLRVTLVPFILLSLNFIASFFVDSFQVVTCSSWIGFFTSWVYLRYFKEGGSGRQLSLLPYLNETNEPDAENNSLTNSRNLKGDRTSQFALYTFFPKPLSYLVSFVSNHVFTALVYLKLLKSADFEYDDDAEEGEGETTQTDLISQMSQSRLLTSSSLAGVSGDVPILSSSPFKNSIDRVLGILKKKRATDENPIDKRRQLALMQLDYKLDGVV